jgi:hypothetical protein
MNYKLKLPLIRTIFMLLLAVSILVLYQPVLAQGIITANSTGTSTEKSGTSLEGSTPTFSSSEAAPSTSTYPQAVEAARAALAARLRISINSVRVVSYQYVVWRDSCLGIHYPNEGCLTVLTPGYRVVLEANGQLYVAHTDLTGKNIRWAPATN